MANILNGEARGNNINGNAANYPLMGDYTTFQPMVDSIYGIGANIVGQPFNVYRITGSSNGNVIDANNLLFSNYPVDRCLLSGKAMQAFETAKTQECYFYQLTADFSQSLVGDVFVLNDNTYGQGANSIVPNSKQFVAFALSIHPVLKIPIGARLDRNIKIYRKAFRPNSSVEGLNNYLASTLDQALPIQIINGKCILGSAGNPASFIPAGFMPIRRGRGDMYHDIPDVPPHTHWSAYIIPMPGYTPHEGDAVVSEEGDRYRIINPYRQDTGISGFQVTLERETMQP